MPSQWCIPGTAVLFFLSKELHRENLVVFPKHSHSPFETKELPRCQLSCTTQGRRVWAPTRGSAVPQLHSSTTQPKQAKSRGPLASSASSHQVTELAAFLCDSQLCPDLSLHCSSHHLGRPQQITGFPTHRAQPLIPNFIHYNALIITLRLPKFPA